ncbi:MAG: SDR family oxidoreductase [Candidatus Baltobacteraceae bacterium]
MAIVTGGASGIGKATCERLARDGFRVAVADRDELGAHAVADAVGGHAFVIDVTDESALVALFERALEAFGRLDALATLAGVSDPTPFMNVSANSLRRVYDVNVTGTILCVREAASRMPSGGRICTLVGTARDAPPEPNATIADAAGTGALIAATRYAARVLAERGITVNGVARHPLSEGPASVAALADAIAWLLSPAASFVRGEIITVDPAPTRE